MYSDFPIERGLESDPEDDPDFADMNALYSDTIGSAMSHRAELQHAMRPWEPARPTEPPAKVEDLSVRRQKERERNRRIDNGIQD
jgi:hypothetical protein